MNPIEFEGQNKELKKPHGMTDEECISLPVHVTADHVVSCWHATFRERLVFLFTGNLWIWIMTGSGTQPPIAPVIIKGSPVAWRKVGVFKRKKWRETTFSKIRKGDTFWMFEPTGELVEVEYEGHSLFVATEKPHQQDVDGIKGNWVVPHENYEDPWKGE